MKVNVDETCERNPTPHTPEAGKAGNPAWVLFFIHIFKTSNTEGQYLICRGFLILALMSLPGSSLSLYSFPFPHVFVYLCPTGAWWVRVSDASAASSENLHTPPFMWHGLNFNPKYSAKDRKLTKVRNSYSALAFFLLHRTGVNSRKSPRRAVKM